MGAPHARTDAQEIDVHLLHGNARPIDIVLHTMHSGCKASDGVSSERRTFVVVRWDWHRRCVAA